MKRARKNNHKIGTRNLDPKPQTLDVKPRIQILKLRRSREAMLHCLLEPRASAGQAETRGLAST